METKKYFFQPEKKILKQGFFMEDENKNVVYEGKMLTQPLLGAMEFEFINHVSGKSEKHKVGHTVTTETESLFGFFSTKSSFKFDGKNVWDYLHEMGVRIDSNLASAKIGMTYTVSLEGKQIATVATSSPGGVLPVTSGSFYDVVTDEEHLDLAFLAAFAFARTDQAFYS